MKTCSNINCLAQNPQLLENFNKNKFNKDGLQHRCRNCQKTINSLYRQNNEDKVREYRKDRYCINKNKEAEYKRKYRLEKSFKHAGHEAKRRASKLKRTPKWLTSEQLKRIEQFYKEAQETNQSVDHIVPLQGNIVSGLHVPWNLQILPLSENARKRNNF